MNEDKNLNGVPDDEEVVNSSLNEVELDEMTEALVKTGDVVIAVDPAAEGGDETAVVNINIGEAEGSGASEAAEASESEVEVSDEAPAEAESETEESVDEVVEEVVPLTVYLTFDKDADRVPVEVTEEFQLDLRRVCNEQGTRFTEFEVEGDLDSVNLRLLLNALK